MKPANRLFQLFINARLATLLCCSLLVSCGGSGSVTTAGIGGTGISYGAVSGFGSIILNGSELDDSTASVTLDGIPSISGSSNHWDLKEGMVVKVSGDFSGNSGTATTIEYKDNLEGEVCNAPVASDGVRTLRVLGQKVILDATTYLGNPATINSIIAGDILEVSGLPDDQERIHASFVEVKTSATEVEVKGRVSNVIGSSTFTINALDVDFSSIGIINGVPADGQFVEVKGTFTCGSARDTLVATSIELEFEGAGDISANDHNEVEGLITIALNPPGGPGTFNIGNRQIQTTSSTRFLPEGFDSSDLLVLGTKVEAEGTSTGGVLTATKISFRENVKLESDVNLTTLIGSSPTFSFELSGLPGVTITTNIDTDFNGVTVTAGGHISVRGIEGPNNTVLATRLGSPSGVTDAILQGAADTISGTRITLLGTTIVTSTTISEFNDVKDSPITSATFLGLVKPGTLVKFKGTLSGSTITWEEAELEDD